jgi:hypothetical protein
MAQDYTRIATPTAAPEWRCIPREKMARTWPLRYLIRHTAFHTLDHAWEMEARI